jgi:hypothetical protein
MSAPPTVPNTADRKVGADMQERGAAAGSMCIRLLIITSTLLSSVVGMTAVFGHQRLLMRSRVLKEYAACEGAANQ